MKYKVITTPDADRSINKWRKAGTQEHKKFLKLIPELEEHPRTGTAHPEPLVKGRDDVYSRRLSAQHRLVYVISDEEIIVNIVSAEGHYGDK